MHGARCSTGAMLVVHSDCCMAMMRVHSGASETLVLNERDAAGERHGFCGQRWRLRRVLEEEEGTRARGPGAQAVLIGKKGGARGGEGGQYVEKASDGFVA